MSFREAWSDFREWLGLDDGDDLDDFDQDDEPPDPNDPNDIRNYELEYDDWGRELDSNGDLLFGDEPCDDDVQTGDQDD